MRRNPFKKGLLTSVFITMLLITTLNILSSPEATVFADTETQTTIASITPESGHVGDVVQVIGDINTINGSYLILFDEEMVKDGTATGTAVNDTFIVPPRLMGNYTVTLHDKTTKGNYTSPKLFNVQTAYFIKAVVPSPPEQLQEGESTKILVNVTGGAENTRYLANVTVTDPSGAVFYNDTLQLTNTTNTGYGEANITYPADFSARAHTNYTGTYHIGFNETLATSNFTVRLTDKLEYRRIDGVHIQGTGYKATENVTVNIRYYNDTSLIPVKGYPKTENASDGIVTYIWQIPDNATLGTYNITLTGTITEKPAKDTQNFTVIFIAKPLLNQSRGRWETPIRVVGEIATLGGNYSILWDGESIRKGTCDPYSGVVNDTFAVPISVKGGHNITLYDVANETESPPSAFEVTTTCHVSATPDRIQERYNTTITVDLDEAKVNATYTFILNVTDPAGQPHTASRTIAVDDTGSGKNSTIYWSDFTDTNTDYVGTYRIAVNETLAAVNFTVGLTNRLEYPRRIEEKYVQTTGDNPTIVRIRGSGYYNETVTINITYYNDTSLVPVEEVSKNASDGIVTHIWQIPDNATLGTYNITLTSATIKKPVKDTQNFTVIEIIVSCQAQNKYDKKSLAGVSVKAYLGPLLMEEFRVGSEETNRTGWVDFLVDQGYYSFGTYWRGVRVGATNGSVTRNGAEYALRIRFCIKCELAHIAMMVSDKDGPLPFIEVTLRNVTLAPKKIPPLRTNYTGRVSTKAFTKTIYRIEARRYGHLFFNQSIGNLTKTIGNLTDPYPIPCPTFTLFIHVSDSKEHPLQNATVEVIEWSSGRIAGKGKTSHWGSVRLDCTFGRYKVRVYNLEETDMLNETVVDVVRNRFYLVLHCRTVNLDLSVKVIDYFGQPIPNAMVKIERGGMEILNLTTGPDGIASEHEILGGYYRISLYAAGRLCRVKSLDLDESREIIFQVGDCVMVGGYPLESNQLITGISLTVLVVLSALALIYRRRPKES